MQKQKVPLTLFSFKVFKKFPRLLTIPCQWAIKAFCASVFATERDDPLTKLALDVLGAYLIIFKQLHVKSLNLKGNVSFTNLWNHSNEEIVVPGCTIQAREKFLSSSYHESFHRSFPHKLSAAVWKAELGTWPQPVLMYLLLHYCYHWSKKDWLLLELHGNSVTRMNERLYLPEEGKFLNRN